MIAAEWIEVVNWRNYSGKKKQGLFLPQHPFWLQSVWTANLIVGFTPIEKTHCRKCLKRVAALLMAMLIVMRT